MKGLVWGVVFVLAGFPLFGNASDTTVTSFEIYLKRRSADSPLGFNTCSIDRIRIYNLVMEKLRTKIRSTNFQSIHDPLVLMRFHDVSRKLDHSKNEITTGVKESMNGHRYDYFIKVYGHLDIDRPLNQLQKATFTLKIYIFDSQGNLVRKSKSKSRHRHLDVLDINTSTGEEQYPLNEQEFFELVTDAADTIDISI